MISILLKRLAGLVPVFFGITVVSFFVIHLAPGKPTDIQTTLNPKVSYEAKLRWEKMEGFDKPIYVQYATWLGRFLRLDFGRSHLDGRKVLDKISERIPVTILLNSLSLALILSIGIPLGILSAVKRNSILDRLTTTGVFVAFSAPEFWIALLLMSLFGITLGWLPISGIKSLDFEYLSIAGKTADIARHLILPVAIAASGSLAGISRYMRSSMVHIMTQDYIRTARAKGMSEKDVIYKHALKNAMLPVVTILGLSVPGLIGGSVIFESIFAIPGMGRLFYEAVMARDFNTIMGILSIGAVLTLIGNLLADIAYFYADPRIRVTGGKP
jgi:peptide/nickel transport system permease protein